jgi:predicted Zn-dependent peptidase
MTPTLIKREILPNGIRLVTENVPTFHTVTIGVLIERGSKNDPPDKKGLAHFVEHILVRKGKDILGKLDSLGGWFEAYTERECTFYYIRLLDTYLPEGFEILSQLINERQITDEDCEQEKSIVFNEIEIYQEDRSQISQQAIIEKMWSGHPLGTPIIGEAESIKYFTSHDVVEFLRSNYLSINMIISVVGSNISHSTIKKLVINKFKICIAVAEVEANSYIYQQVPIKKIGHLHINKGDNTNFVYYSIGINSLHRTHPERVVLFALSSLLGEGLNSRLFQRLRLKEGYTYDIQSSYQLFSEGGILSISGMSNCKTLSKIIHGVEIELKYLMNETATEDEIVIVKNRLKSNLIFNLENPELRMIRLAKLESWFRRTFYIEEELEMIENISTERIKNLAISLLSNGANLYTIGNNNIRDVSWTM